MRIATDRLVGALNADPELRLTARLWTTRIRYSLGDDAFVLDLRDGRVVDVVDAPTIFDDFAIDIAAPDDVWDKILSPVPPPFCQDLFPAQLHHGLRIAGDLESVFAYYGAVRRITELMRAVRNDAAQGA